MTLLRKIGFFSAFLLPALVVAGYYLGGAFHWLSILFVFVFLPFADALVGISKANVPEDQKPQVGEEFFYRLITYGWVYVHFSFLVWSAWAVSNGVWTAWELVPFTIGVALVTGGIGITVAHELGHKKSALERFYSQALLMTVSYMHFYIEHNQGHHVHVATPADPATARKHQNFYQFWVQSVVGSMVHAWQLETARCQRLGVWVYGWRNRMIAYGLLTPLFFLVICLVFPSQPWWRLPLFLVVQAVLAFTLLELVNYVEHYGMERKELAPGQYERVNPLHSWNASHLISNFFLFQLQRHSDHHYHASKRYQILDHWEESPQLPYGYPTMILVALVPPLWFRMMNNCLENWTTRQRA